MAAIPLTAPAQTSVARAEAQSNTFFGCSITTCLALLSGLLTAMQGNTNPIPLMLGTCAFLVVLWSPKSFGPANLYWKKSLIALGQAVIILIWATYILPSGLIMQARGRDPLNLKFDPKATTYWKTPLPTSNMEKSM